MLVIAHQLELLSQRNLFVLNSIVERVPDMNQSNTTKGGVVTPVRVELIATLFRRLAIQLEHLVSSETMSSTATNDKRTSRARPQNICLVVESPEKTAWRSPIHSLISSAL
jgi:hypothetical protein